ncbi:MAG TPA: hypothetical protein VHQ20_00640 [Patescibacteria group bacterium]|jgi:hypothetical protein|nr:hypothetical protein [Patescibacteria group bacterium]
MADDEDVNGAQGSPRYVDETMDADENLRPDLEETQERGTDKEPEIDGAE